MLRHRELFFKTAHDASDAIYGLLPLKKVDSLLNILPRDVLGTGRPARLELVRWHSDVARPKAEIIGSDETRRKCG